MSKICERFFKSVLLSFFLLNSLCLNGMDSSSGDGQPQSQTAELAEINKEFEHVAAEFDKELPALQLLREDFSKFLDDVDLSDSGWFRDFRNKVLCTLPTESSFTMGVYGEDVLHLLFLIAYVFVDKIFFDNVKKYYFQVVASNFKEKRELLLSCYNEISGLETKKFLEDSKLKQKFIKDCCSALNIDQGLDYRLFSNVFINLFFKEMVKFFEHQVFPAGNTGFFSLLRKAKKNEERHVISPYPMIESYLILYFFGIAPFVEDKMPILRGFLLRLVGWDYKILSSYGFDLSKRTLVLGLFLKRLTIWYQNLFKVYLNKNMELFSKILSGLRVASQIDDEHFKIAEAELKDFIVKGFECSFKKWFDYKNRCCSNFGLLFETILLLPVICKGGKLIYDNYVSKG